MMVVSCQKLQTSIRQVCTVVHERSWLWRKCMGSDCVHRYKFTPPFHQFETILKGEPLTARMSDTYSNELKLRPCHLDGTARNRAMNDLRLLNDANSHLRASKPKPMSYSRLHCNLQVVNFVACLLSFACSGPRAGLQYENTLSSSWV